MKFEENMCLQCMTNARMIKENIFPGWHLKQSMKHHPDWPKGWYGLLRCNDPDFIWKEKMIPMPLMYNESPKANQKKIDDWFETLSKFESELFITSILVGYELYKACLKSGYKPKKDGYRICLWIVNSIGKVIQEDEKKQYKK